MTSKRKATHLENNANSVTNATASALKRPRTVRAIATKEPRKPPHPSTTNFADTTTTTAASLLQTRPWITRPQHISEQDLWILHSRDNLVPGATGPKDWHVLAAEFNKRFEDELKKPLAYNTLSKRCGTARKTFLKDNPEYAGVCVYPVPEAEAEAGEESEDSAENVGQADTQKQSRQYPPNLEILNVRDEDSTNLAKAQTTAKPTDILPTPLPFSPSALRGEASSSKLTTRIPGSFNPSTIQDNYIPPTTRAKFHLRHRTNEPVTFHFFDPHEESLTKDDPQYVDADTLKSTSPLYSRKALRGPESAVINVPEHIGTRTVNIFVQLISPERANELPTHHLWKAQTPVPGVYDRHGAIDVEKIVWSVDTLLELLLLAQWMEVYWIVDMVIDRLHYLFAEQAKYKDLFATIGTPTRGYVNIGGQQVFVGRQLPPVENLLASIAAEDFDEDFLPLLAKTPVGKPVWRFVADMIYALGGKVEGVDWLTAMSKEVQHIFSHTDERYLDAATTRQEFCARYHHHSSDSDACYTSHPAHSATHIINTLYASPYPQRGHLSGELASASSLVDILYSSTGDVDRLNNDNSTRLMLESEKMVLEMESRLHETRDAMWRAREASEGEKKAATDEASRVARAMYSQTRCSVKEL